MAKKKIDYKILEKNKEGFEKFRHNFTLQILRRGSYKWPAKNIIKTEARIERGMYKCFSCSRCFGPKEIEVDHIIPVIPVTGWDSFDKYIERLFCDSNNLQVLCKNCHSIKTSIESNLRSMNSKKNKK